MKLTDRFNNWTHPFFVKYVLRQYRRKSEKVEREHPELFKEVDPELMRKHKALWERLGLPCSGRWLQVHVNLTGIQDYRFCPEDIFFARIERILNDCSTPGYGFEDKNLLSFYLKKENQPETYFRYINGLFFDDAYAFLSRERVEELLRTDAGDLVAKPCVCSSGGNNVQLLQFSEGSYVDESGNAFTTTRLLEGDFPSYIVQRKIIQADFPASFNSSSVNTCRMITLRCPWDGKMVVLKTMMRMGVRDTVLDNMMKGGLCVNLDANGLFGKYGYDYNGKRYEKHPTSGIVFEGLRYPHFDQMCDFAISIAARIPTMNLLSFDLVPGLDGEMKCVEINATSQGITQLQYDHGGLFGEYSGQVVDWCYSNMKNDRFAHVRTFY